jgi:hypothetical protein
MLKGETMLSGAQPRPCDICESTKLNLDVMRTYAYYVGTACGECGIPYSRETGYFKTREEAQAALSRIKRGNLEDARR